MIKSIRSIDDIFIHLVTACFDTKLSVKYLEMRRSEMKKRGKGRKEDIRRSVGRSIVGWRNKATTFLFFSDVKTRPTEASSANTHLQTALLYAMLCFCYAMLFPPRRRSDGVGGAMKERKRAEKSRSSLVCS